MKNLMVLMVNLLEAKHVSKTSWNLKKQKNTSETSAQRIPHQKVARKEMFWGLEK